MIATKSEIVEFIPQRGVMVMIDELLEVDEKISKTSLRVLENNLFIEHGCFSESGLIENMAQTAAAGAGYRYKQKSQKPPIGFIASIKDLRINKVPPVGSQIITTCTVTEEIMGVTIVEGLVYYNGEVIASCQLRIFLKNE
jgi:predicted hotdog family 3-hydroxylacyl-ACP dehydratase